MRHLLQFLLLLVGAMSSFSAASAAVPLDVIQAELANLKERAIDDSEWRIGQAAAMAELLARQAALSAQLNPDKKGAADWVAEADKIGVRDKLKQVALDPKFLTNLPPELRDLAKKCILASADAPIANNPSFELKGCDQATRQSLESALKDAETHAAVAYEQCRDVVLSKAPEYHDLLPANAHDPISPASLTALGSYPNKSVSACAGAIQDAVAQLKDVKDAKSLVSSALTLAANVCFASGGNPWVCGAMLVIAFVMEIFDGSGGGRGDGPGDGIKGGAAGGQSVPAVNAGPHREGDDQRQAREAASSNEITQGPATNFGPTANLGSPNVKSNAFCNGAADQIVCFLQAVKGSDRYFFGDARIAQLANAPRQGAITVCGDKEVTAIVIPEGKQFRVFGHNDQGSTDGGIFNSPTAACASVH